MVANTDTRHYLNLTSSVYRFYPLVVTKAEVAMIHGHDERLSLTNLFQAVRFYHSFIFGADYYYSSMAQASSP